MRSTSAASIRKPCWLSVRFRSRAATKSSRTGFTIRAEKCPNRKGVEAIVSRLSGALDELGRLPGPGRKRRARRGLAHRWLQVRLERRRCHCREFDDVPLLIVQDCFASPLWDRADYQLPGATFAEREGSYVNCHRPAAIVRVGHSSAGRRAWSKAASTGNCSAVPGLYQRERCAGRNRPRNDRTSAPPPRACPTLAWT